MIGFFVPRDLSMCWTIAGEYSWVEAQTKEKSTAHQQLGFCRFWGGSRTPRQNSDLTRRHGRFLKHQRETKGKPCFLAGS